ncbi:recombinase family protein [Mucilaginibacter sp. AW1-7]|uniref:recombinase family protein n=1 Tax=Mucilaginibacter sp. AW1-7 TaxID=3349874 RepID=UPI003F732573
MKDEKTIYIQYARKSSEGENRQSLSIPAQLRDNEERVIRPNGLTILKTITDEASASTPNNRPGYTEMMRLIKEGKASGIVAWHVDRVVRNELEDGEVRWLLRSGLIRSIWTPTREYRSEDNTLLLGIETSMASQYTIDLARKVRNGNRQMWEKGQPGGVAKLGYLNTKFQEHGSNYLLEDPERFHVLRKGFELMLTGKYNVQEVHAKLTSEYGLITRTTKRLGGKPVALCVLYRIFADPFYCGRFYRNGRLYRGSYKPMITAEEFDTIQKILGRKNKPMQQKHEFAFTGLMRCGACGCAITASRKLKIVKATGEYKTYAFYHCTKRRGKEACGERHYTTEKEMTELIASEISKLNLIPKWKEWAVRTLAEDYQQALENSKELLSSAKGFESRLQAELGRLIDLRIANDLTEEQYRSKKAEREVELILIQEKIKRMESGFDLQKKQIDDLFDFVENITERFKAASYREQRSICAYFGWNWVLQGKKLTFTRQSWFYDIEELKSFYEANKGALEPIKSYIEFRQSPYFERVLITLRRLRESIRTEERQNAPVGTEGALQDQGEIVI